MRIAIISVLSLLVVAGIVRASASGGGSLIELHLELGPAQDMNISHIFLDPGGAYTAEPGENITVPVRVYRGKTLKRTVYIWIEDKAGTRVSSRSKLSLPDRFTAYNLSVNLSLSTCLPDADYALVAEGLDVNTTRTFHLSMGCAEEVQDGEVSFIVLDAPGTVASGMPFSIRLQIQNPTKDNLEVSAWSYVYRSSKCYSGEREQNLKGINLPEYSNVTFDLENTAIAPDGDYSLKIKFLRSDRKTPEEITLPIKVESRTVSGKNASSEAKLDNLAVPESSVASIPFSGDSDEQSSKSAEKRTLFSSNTSSNRSGPETVYRSSSARAWNIAVYFLIAVLVLVLIALVFRKL